MSDRVRNAQTHDASVITYHCFQQLAIEFSAIVFWQRRNELDPTWILIKSDSLLHELFDLFGEFLVCSVAITRDDEGFRFHQSITLIMAHHCTLEHGFVLEQTVFNLRGSDEHAADLQHVVRPSVIPIETFIV